VVAVLIAVCSAAASSATGAQIDQLRESAQKSRQQVSQLKRRQSELRAQLDEVAARIALLKEQKRNLLPDNELKSLLRRSQDLSRQLTDMAHSLSDADAKAQQRELALLAGLSDELRRVRAEWDGNPERDARQRLIAQMRSLRAEREQVRALLPTAAVPVPESSLASDDPETLLEQADALRDSEDKLREQVRALDVRIAEAHEERELDRRMRDFLGDEAMFDEQDRRFRLHREPEGFSSRTDSPREGTSTPTGAGDSPAPSASAQAERAAQKPPQPEEARRQIAGSSPGDSVESLEAQRERLRTLADDLHKRASRVESRARESR